MYLSVFKMWPDIIYKYAVVTATGEDFYDWKLIEKTFIKKS